MEETLTFPDLTEAVIGWKAMDIASSYESPVLISPQQRTHWPAFQALEAFCTHEKDKRLKCNCGINAFKSVEKLSNDFSWQGQPVWVELYLWGEVQKGEWGWRAQYAYPKRIVLKRYFDETTIQSLRDRYGVEVTAEVTDPPPVAEPRTPWEILAIVGGGVAVAGLIGFLGYKASKMQDPIQYDPYMTDN